MTLGRLEEGLEPAQAGPDLLEELAVGQPAELRAILLWPGLG